MKSIGVFSLLSILGSAVCAVPTFGSQTVQSVTAPTSPSTTVSAALTSNLHDFAMGAPVELTFAITNHSKSPIKYQFNNGEQYDVVITDANGNTVWTWSKNKVFDQLITNQSIAVGQELTYNIKWTQRDDKDRPVAPGVYTATATLLPMAGSKISGNLLTNLNSDPVNTGMPMMDPVQKGTVKIVNTTPSLNAKTTFVVDSST